MGIGDTVDLRKQKKATEKFVENPPLTEKMLKRARKSKMKVEEFVTNQKF